MIVNIGQDKLYDVINIQPDGRYDVVDLNDIIKLEQEQRSSVQEHIYAWGRFVGVSFGTKVSVLKALYERYHGQPTDFVKKMLRSKTGLNDLERLYHESMIRAYPDWLYEVELIRNTVTHSIDFIDLNEQRLIEVKNISSWKQVCTLFLYRNSYPGFRLCAAFFGTKPSPQKLDDIKYELSIVGIESYWVTEDGNMERLAWFEPDEI